MLFDRYRIEKTKEFWGGLWDKGAGGLLRIVAFGNTGSAARVISVSCILFIILFAGWLFALLKPKAQVPVSKPLTLTETDADGNKWVMDYLKDQNIRAILDGKTKPGQPLTVKVKFYRKSQSILLMKPEVTGTAGEQYFPGTIKNGQWQAPPKLRIADQNGQLIHLGQFEYG